MEPCTISSCAQCTEDWCRALRGQANVSVGRLHSGSWSVCMMAGTTAQQAVHDLELACFLMSSLNYGCYVLPHKHDLQHDRRYAHSPLQSMPIRQANRPFREGLHCS